LILELQAKGDNMTDVSNQLGHYSVKLTLDVYNHWMPGGKKSKVDALDNLKSPEEGKKQAVNEGWFFLHPLAPLHPGARSNKKGANLFG
jgi:hypothetical protein